MLKVFSLLALLFSSPIQASIFIAESCPDHYIGKVVVVEELDEVDHIMAKNKIKLEVTESESSEEFIEFKYLKHAMVSVEVDKEYKVGMRKGKLCLLERLR